MQLALKTEKIRMANVSQRESEFMLCSHTHTPILLLSFLTSCQRMGFSQHYNHSCYWCAVIWPWPIPKEPQRTHTSQGFLSYSLQLIKTPFPNPLARKICFCPSFCYSQALYSSLSGLILDQIWEIKHGKNGNIPYGVFVQVLTSIHMLFFKFLS